MVIGVQGSKNCHGFFLGYWESITPKNINDARICLNGQKWIPTIGLVSDGFSDILFFYPECLGKWSNLICAYDFQCVGSTTHPRRANFTSESPLQRTKIGRFLIMFDSNFWSNIEVEKVVCQAIYHTRCFVEWFLGRSIRSYVGTMNHKPCKNRIPRVDGSEIRLTSWGWWFIPITLESFIYGRWSNSIKQPWVMGFKPRGPVCWLSSPGGTLGGGWFQRSHEKKGPWLVGVI